MSVRRFAVLVVWNGALLLALLLTAGVSAVTTMRVVLSSQDVVVPSLLGQRIPEAGTLLRSRGLLLRVDGKRHDARVPADRIAAQEPAGGTALKANRSVRVWLSLGPQRLTVPAVEGQSVRSARLSLEQAGLTLARVVEVDAAAPEDVVLVQRPPAGEAELGAGISLLASRGRLGRDYVMPDLIGRKAEDVLEVLRMAGLKVADVRYRTYPGAGVGVILRQTPPAGHRVSAATSVGLDVSRGPL